jgi:small subunit ribosomal protein S1
VKQLWDDPWAGAMDAYKPGTVVEEATVLSQADFGIFVRIADGIEGLVPSGEIPGNAQISVGGKVRAEISNVDSIDRRITLTMRNPGESPEADQVQALKREQTGKGATLGDVLKEKLESMKKSPSMPPPPPKAPEADDEE